MPLHESIRTPVLHVVADLQRATHEIALLVVVLQNLEEIICLHPVVRVLHARIIIEPLLHNLVLDPGTPGGRRFHPHEVAQAAREGAKGNAAIVGNKGGVASKQLGHGLLHQHTPHLAAIRPCKKRRPLELPPLLLQARHKLVHRHLLEVTLAVVEQPHHVPPRAVLAAVSEEALDLLRELCQRCHGRDEPAVSDLPLQEVGGVDAVEQLHVLSVAQVPRRNPLRLGVQLALQVDADGLVHVRELLVLK
mmetsp:Transcript_136447/g.423961  ORF Transcript_136447/g.423961 Transcript_136447/m.423961 type:complete len:249 (+) Transcript_136447:1471-2217(+)